MSGQAIGRKSTRNEFTFSRLKDSIKQAAVLAREKPPKSWTRMGRLQVKKPVGGPKRRAHLMGIVSIFTGLTPICRFQSNELCVFLYFHCEQCNVRTMFAD